MYEFDRMGYLVIKNLLKEEQVRNLLSSINLLERHAIQNLKKPPRKTSPWGPEYHFNKKKVTMFRVKIKMAGRL